MAAKGKENRIIITLACTECKSRNYVTTKNKKNDPERMELRKYCPRCREHRPHRETKYPFASPFTSRIACVIGMG